MRVLGVDQPHHWISLKSCFDAFIHAFLVEDRFLCTKKIWSSQQPAKKQLFTLCWMTFQGNPCPDPHFRQMKALWAKNLWILPVDVQTKSKSNEWLSGKKYIPEHQAFCSHLYSNQSCLIYPVRIHGVLRSKDAEVPPLLSVVHLGPSSEALS